MATPTVKLLLADVDGTLVTQDKILTDRAIEAVHKLHESRRRDLRDHERGGRPLRMAMLVEPLDIQTPIAAFNGGLLVDRDIERDRAARPARRSWSCRWPTRWRSRSSWTSGSLQRRRLGTCQSQPGRVAREAWTVKFEPKVHAAGWRASADPRRGQAGRRE